MNQCGSLLTMPTAGNIVAPWVYQGIVFSLVGQNNWEIVFFVVVVVGVFTCRPNDDNKSIAKKTGFFFKLYWRIIIGIAWPLILLPLVVLYDSLVSSSVWKLFNHSFLFLLFLSRIYYTFNIYFLKLLLKIIICSNLLYIKISLWWKHCVKF